MRRQAGRSYTDEDIVGKHPAMKEILFFLPVISESESSVLIEGPTGSGKELIARAIHQLSPRKSGPFVAVNCAALEQHSGSRPMTARALSMSLTTPWRKMKKYDCCNETTR